MQRRLARLVRGARDYPPPARHHHHQPRSMRPPPRSRYKHEHGSRRERGERWGYGRHRHHHRRGDHDGSGGGDSPRSTTHATGSQQPGGGGNVATKVSSPRAAESTAANGGTRRGKYVPPVAEAGKNPFARLPEAAPASKELDGATTANERTAAGGSSRAAGVDGGAATGVTFMVSTAGASADSTMASGTATGTSSTVTHALRTPRRPTSRPSLRHGNSTRSEISVARQSSYRSVPRSEVTSMTASTVQDRWNGEPPGRHDQYSEPPSPRSQYSSASGYTEFTAGSRGSAAYPPRRRSYGRPGSEASGLTAVSETEPHRRPRPGGRHHNGYPGHHDHYKHDRRSPRGDSDPRVYDAFRAPGHGQGPRRPQHAYFGGYGGYDDMPPYGRHYLPPPPSHAANGYGPVYGDWQGSRAAYSPRAPHGAYHSGAPHDGGDAQHHRRHRHRHRRQRSPPPAKEANAKKQAVLSPPPRAQPPVQPRQSPRPVRDTGKARPARASLTASDAPSQSSPTPLPIADAPPAVADAPEPRHAAAGRGSSRDLSGDATVPTSTGSSQDYVVVGTPVSPRHSSFSVAGSSTGRRGSTSSDDSLAARRSAARYRAASPATLLGIQQLLHGTGDASAAGPRTPGSTAVQAQRSPVHSPSPDHTGSDPTTSHDGEVQDHLSDVSVARPLPIDDGAPAASPRSVGSTFSSFGLALSTARATTSDSHGSDLNAIGRSLLASQGSIFDVGSPTAVRTPKFRDALASPTKSAYAKAVAAAAASMQDADATSVFVEAEAEAEVGAPQRVADDARNGDAATEATSSEHADASSGVVPGILLTVDTSPHRQKASSVAADVVAKPASGDSSTAAASGRKDGDAFSSTSSDNHSSTSTRHSKLKERLALSLPRELSNTHDFDQASPPASSDDAPPAVAPTGRVAVASRVVDSDEAVATKGEGSAPVQATKSGHGGAGKPPRPAQSKPWPLKPVDARRSSPRSRASVASRNSRASRTSPSAVASVAKRPSVNSTSSSTGHTVMQIERHDTPSPSVLPKDAGHGDDGSGVSGAAAASGNPVAGTPPASTAAVPTPTPAAPTPPAAPATTPLRLKSVQSGPRASTPRPGEQRGFFSSRHRAAVVDLESKSPSAAAASKPKSSPLADSNGSRALVGNPQPQPSSPRPAGRHTNATPSVPATQGLGASQRSPRPSRFQRSGSLQALHSGQVQDVESDDDGTGNNVHAALLAQLAKRITDLSAELRFLNRSARRRSFVGFVKSLQGPVAELGGEALEVSTTPLLQY